MANPDPQTLQGGQQHVHRFPVTPVPRLRCQQDPREAALRLPWQDTRPVTSSPWTRPAPSLKTGASNFLPLPVSLHKLVFLIGHLLQLERIWAGWTQSRSSFSCPALLLVSWGFGSPLRGLQWRGELVFGMLLAGGTLILKIFSPPHLRLGSISPVGLLVGFAQEMRLRLL